MDLGRLRGIDQLWVHEGHRGEGWGTRLVRAAEDEARRRGCTRMVVSSITFQAPAFYRRYGYAETGRTEGLPGGHADVHFWKALDDTAAEPRLRVVVLIDLPEDRHASLLLALLTRHGGHLDQRLRTADARTEIHHLSFGSREGYIAYRAELVDVELSIRVLEVQEVAVPRLS